MYVVFDFETGGTNPPYLPTMKHNPAVQLGLLAVDDDMQELDALDIKLQFEHGQCEPGVIGVKNSWNSEAWEEEAEHPRFARRTALDFFRSYSVERISRAGKPYGVAQLIGWNAIRFDLYYLDWLFYKNDPDRIWTGATSWVGTGGCIDVMQRAQAYEEVYGRSFKNLQQETVHAALFGAPHEGAHDAVADCRATARIYGELLRRFKG